MAEFVAPLPAPPAPAGGPVFVLAGWGRRAGAYAIDFLIILVPMLAIWAFLLPPFIRQAGDDQRLQDDLDRLVDSDGEDFPMGRFLYWTVVITLVATVAYWVVIGLYSAIFTARTQGQTPGRRLMKIRLMRVDGAPITFWWALYRTMVIREALFGVGSLLTGGFLQLAQYLWPLGDHQRRTLHDMVSRSRVVIDAGQPR